MDHQPSPSERGGGPTTPRRQLQGSRPPRLDISKESHAIKNPAPSGPPRRARARVIKYMASPKVIHANPSERRALVERLTGLVPSAKLLPPGARADDDGMHGQPFLPPNQLLSPAARLATIERSVRPMPELPLDYVRDDDDGTLATALVSTPRPPGILSPLPSSLPLAAALGLFSPPPLEGSCVSWLNGLSPILRAASNKAGDGSASGARGPSHGASRRPPPPTYYSDPFVPSPRCLLATPTIPSPTTCKEFFGNLPDISALPFQASSFPFDGNKLSCFSFLTKFGPNNSCTYYNYAGDRSCLAHNQNRTHGTGRDFYEGETGTKDLESDVSDVKVVKRQRLASRQFRDITPSLKSLLYVVKFIVRMKAEKRHSDTFHEDVKAWINITKQYNGGLRGHTSVQQVSPELLGRNNIKEMIMENILLDRNGGSNHTVICINALCGFGKTSLLRVLYNDQRLLDVFDKRIWIQVSNKFDIIVLFRNIVESAMNNHCSITDLRYLQEMVGQEITDKQIGLFLDDADIEGQQLFHSLLQILIASARESVVVMATSSANVADFTGVATHSYFLSPLSEENNLMLLQQCAALGVDIYSNPDLVTVAKRLISRFGVNPLNLKAIGGLLCHTDTISLQNDKLEGSLMPLRLCHDVLPIYLKNCIAFCSLFPEGYVFDKHHLVLLWISHGCVSPVEGCELEDVGAEYFNELMCRSFFQHSPLHNDKDDKFVMHELIYKVVESASRDIYFKSEDIMSSIIPQNILHLSLVSCHLQTVQLGPRTEKLKDLHTFLVVQPEGQQYKTSFPSLKLIGLDDLFLKFTSLEALDLSHIDIKELPGSIGSIRNLRYLSLDNTSIRALPSELCSLSNLQTLKAKDCRFLTVLPGDTKKLLKLRHLDVTKDVGYVQLPHGIGQLTELRTLPVFHASRDSFHCFITELGNLHCLRGCLWLSGLECVKTSVKAKEVNLKDKQHLQNVTLQWHDGGADIDEDNDDDEAENEAEQVLEGLEPHSNLQELAIRGYEGTAFPAWMQGPSSLPNLVSLTLDSCCNCTQFPAIAQLPSLKFLGVRKMYDVQRLSSEVIGTIRFPSLELLNLWKMYGLEELFQASERDCPRLHKICVSRCPDLKSLPSIPSVVELVLHCCHQLPDIPDLLSLASLKIEGFHGVKSFSLTQAALPVLKKLEIRFANSPIPDGMYTFQSYIDGSSRCLRQVLDVGILETEVSKVYQFTNRVWQLLHVSITQVQNPQRPEKLEQATWEVYVQSISIILGVILLDNQQRSQTRDMIFFRILVMEWIELNDFIALALTWR
ncbi:hypothetical protein PR202_ga20557 [Eleusine coracana subsp. coracana]|uniref:NB-ARC domain-containing protein n=1 Tax=Eleusine coracana subsp. coracana TaxID=191504 RepID=A0AAV5CYZ4_ELECO|nr:hypothetical protein PR202_ga20557 [Eleusine coracana subsp. coracana]